MKYLKSLITVFLATSLIIGFHELGHLIVAKLVGIQVDSFNIGFGKELLSFTAFDIQWNLGMIPLGGYVKTATSLEDFNLQNFLTLLSGPLSSFLLAEIAIFTFYFIGLRSTTYFFNKDSGITYMKIGNETGRVSKFLFPNSQNYYWVTESKVVEKTQKLDDLVEYEVYKNKNSLKETILYCFCFTFPFFPLFKPQMVFHSAFTHPREKAVVAGPIYIFIEIMRTFAYSPMAGLAFVASFSMGLGFLNLLPIYPTDGGKIFSMLIGGVGVANNIAVEENVWLINTKLLAGFVLIFFFIRITYGDIKRLWKELMKK